MQPVNFNKIPVEVDFNNAESDGAIRLHLPITEASLESLNVKLKEGLCLWVTDGDIEVNGIATFRDGIWVLKVNDDDYHDLEKNSPFRNENRN